MVAEALKSSFGNVKVVVTRHDRLVYAVARKPYARKKPYPEHITRVKPFLREKAAIILLRRHGYTINQLAGFLGRSTSFIYRVLRTAILRLTLRSIDMRKLPGTIRLSTSIRRRLSMEKYRAGWEAFLLGAEDKPP